MKTDIRSCNVGTMSPTVLVHQCRGVLLILAMLGAPSLAQEEDELGSHLLGNFLVRSSGQDRGPDGSRFVPESPSKKLQLAFVIDGTNSMESHLARFKVTFGSLVHNLIGPNKSNNVEVAVVVYRDEQSGPVDPLADFTPVSNKHIAKRDSLMEKVDTLQPRTGAPFNREMVDVGVHYALEKLRWADRAQDNVTERWLLLCADAPPYPEGVRSDEHKEENQPPRKHKTKDLIKKARARGVQIKSVLLGNTLVANQQDALREGPEAVAFMRSLSLETGGRFADLRRPQVVEYWTRNPTIEPISNKEIESARTQAKRKELATRYALLPSPHQLRGRARVVEGEIRDRARELWQASSVADQADAHAWNPATIQACAAKHPAAYFVEVNVRPYLNKVFANARLWGRTGETAAQTESLEFDAKPDLNETIIAREVLRSLLEDAVKRSKGDEDSASRFRIALESDLLSGQGERWVKGASSSLHRANRLLQQVPFNVASEKVAASKAKLLQAVSDLEQAAKEDKANPLVHYLLALGHLKLSRLLDQSLVRSSHFKLHEKSMHDAWDCLPRRRPMTEPPFQTLIRAHCLTHRREHKKAVRLLDQLISDPQVVWSATARRANWLLAGIRLGEWNTVDHRQDRLIDAVTARDHLVQILALWPESPEAEFCRAYVSESGDPLPILSEAFQWIASDSPATLQLTER